MPGYISGYDKNIYHLLCGAFRESISISKVIDFDIFDVIAISDVHVSVDIASARTRDSWR